MDARRLGNIIAVAGAATLLPFVRLLPSDWRLFNDGDVTPWLLLCSVLGCAALLVACVMLALGRTRRGRLFFCAALLFALSLPLGQMPVQRWLSAAALLVGLCGRWWGRSFGRRALRGGSAGP